MASPPNGIYAYFATLETSLTDDANDPFDNFKKPKFPYLLGENFWAQPNEFNFLSKSNQDEINLNKTFFGFCILINNYFFANQSREFILNVL